MKKQLLWLLPLTLLSQSVHASEQAFLGIKSGIQWADDDAYPHSSPNSELWGAYLGITLDNGWRWDWGYQHHASIKTNDTHVSINTQLLETTLRYDYALIPQWSLYGRAGAAFWEMEKYSPSQSVDDENGVSPLIELGIGYQLSKPLLASIGYQYIHSIGNSTTQEYDSHSVIAQLAYTFGDK